MSMSNTSINEWVYDFGDGSISTLQNPSHTYSNDGTYIVCLSITAADSCTANFCETVVINCNGQLNCNSAFIMDMDSSGICPTVQFFDLSTSNTSINEWVYDFGDGNTSTIQNPTHTYATNGTYVVCLSTTAADSCVATYCETIVIDCIVGLNETQLEGLILSPNPAQSTIQLSLKQATDIEYQIIGLNGAIYQQGERSGTTTHAFEIYDLEAGMYLLRLKVEDEIQIIRFIKE